MRIMFLAYLHGFGGAERQNVMLANEMAKRGHEVFLASISVDNNCYELDEKIRYFYLPDRETGYKRIITRYQDIRTLLKKIKPDVTVCFWLQSAYLSAFMKASITGKVIYAERSDPGDNEYSGLLGIIRAVALPFIDGFVFQSEGARDYFNKQVQNKSIIIHNPIDIDKNMYSIPCRCREKRIVNIGRLHPQKNQILLIKAFSKISANYQDYILEIYGDGLLKDNLQGLIDSMGLNEKIKLMGTTKNILERIYSASLFVLSSDYEGLPNALMEAMAVGLPCISTDCKPGGARTLIDNKINGIVVRCNDVDELAEAIKEMIDNRDMAETFASRAMEIRQTHTPSEVYTRWENFFRAMVN